MANLELKQVDIYKKLSVLPVVDEDPDNDNSVGAIAQRLLGKKKLNIPICDVHTDIDYEKNVAPTFRLQPSYIKHVKKIGDEVDVSIDYVVDTSDKLWVAGQIRADTGKDLQRLFTYDAFETIINTLERYTAFSKDPIPLIHAQKLILEQLNWKAAHLALSTAVIGEVYQYWLRKRERIGKPLCRRYWPQIASSDSNPHQVFRTRDKERYRLRKQQKRNDVDAFRKMQQLRKEFSKAKVLLELVMEREMLREAEFTVQREIFSQQVFDHHQMEGTAEVSPVEIQQQSMVVEDAGDNEVASFAPLCNESNTGSMGSISSSGGGHAVGCPAMRRAVPYRHTLKFNHIDANEVLLSLSVEGRPQSPFSKLMSLSCSSGDTHDPPEHSSSLPKPPRSSTGANGHTVPSSSSGGAVRKSGSVNDLRKTSGIVAASGETKKATDAAISNVATKLPEESKKKIVVERKKRKEPTSRMVMYTVANGVTVECSSGIAVSAPSSSSGPTPASSAAVNAAAVLSGIDHLNSMGAFNGNVDNSALDGEVRLIHADLDGPQSLCQPQWPSFMVGSGEWAPSSSSYADYLGDLELRRDPQGKVVVPTRFKSRCRVGRGGRLVMDRIPVYESPPLVDTDYWNTDEPTPSTASQATTYVYPTSLRHQHYHTLARETYQHKLAAAAANSNGTTLNVNSSSSGGIAILPSVDAVPSSSSPASSQGAAQVSTAPPQSSMTRHLPEVPLSNKKILKYNLKVRANNLLVTSGGGGTLQQQQRIVPDIPSFVPAARLSLSAQTRQRLQEICNESDSEEERVVVPRAMRGYPELERSIVTKASLASAAAGTPSALDSASSGSNVKFSVHI